MAAAGGAPGAGVTPDGSALGGANGLGSASGPDAGGGSVVGAPLTVGALVEAADAPAPAGFSPVSNCAAALDNGDGKHQERQPQMVGAAAPPAEAATRAPAGPCAAHHSFRRDSSTRNCKSQNARSPVRFCSATG